MVVEDLDGGPWRERSKEEGRKKERGTKREKKKGVSLDRVEFLLRCYGGRKVVFALCCRSLLPIDPMRRWGERDEGHDASFN